MLKKKMVDLLNQELDGTNGPKDSAAVKRLLERSAEAKQYYSDLQSVAAMFKKVPSAEPPAHLKKNILAAIPFPVQHPVVRAARKPLLDGFFSSIGLRYAVTFAGGAVAGILLFALVTNVPSDSTNLVGTMGPNRSAAAEASAEVRLDQVTGSIAASEANGTLTADLNLHSRDEVDVILNFDEHQLKFDSFRPDSDSRSTLTLLEGQVRLTLTGEHRYTIAFLNESNTTPSLTAKLYSQGVLLSSYDLHLERKTIH